MTIIKLCLGLVTMIVGFIDDVIKYTSGMVGI